MPFALVCGGVGPPFVVMKGVGGGGLCLQRVFRGTCRAVTRPCPNTATPAFPQFCPLNQSLARGRTGEGGPTNTPPPPQYPKPKPRKYPVFRIPPDTSIFPIFPSGYLDTRFCINGPVGKQVAFRKNGDNGTCPCPIFHPFAPPFFFLVGTLSYIFHDVFVTTSHFPPFSPISPHFPPFPPISPHFPSFSPFSLIFPWPAGYWDTPDMDTSWACKPFECLVGSGVSPPPWHKVGVPSPCQSAPGALVQWLRVSVATADSHGPRPPV